MSNEILRIFSEENPVQAGRNAQASIPISWEKIAGLAQTRYMEVISRYRKPEYKGEK